MLSSHKAGCACNDCITALQDAVCRTVPIEAQIEAMVAAISDFDVPELLPALKTLQFVRDNQERIRKAMKGKGQHV